MNPELYAAAQLGDWVVIRRSSGKFLAQRTPIGNTVLHVLAQSCDSADVVQRILARNCCLLTGKNARGETALHLAARKGHSGIVRELIDYSKQNKGCWICACFVDRCKRMLRMANVDGNTALHEAVKNNFYEVANLLVQEDPEFRYRPNYAIETPLYLAVEKGYRDFADLILMTCKSPASLGPGHKTALHAAAIWNLPVYEVEVSQLKERKIVGIGIVATKENNVHAAWAMQDISTGDFLLDYTAALKLALCKIRGMPWPDVNLLVSSAPLLRMLRTHKTQDIRLFAQLGDIDMLKALFLTCSFSLIENQADRLGRRISKYATTLVQDEEYLSPLCQTTQL